MNKERAEELATETLNAIHEAHAFVIPFVEEQPASVIRVLILERIVETAWNEIKRQHGEGFELRRDKSRELFKPILDKAFQIKEKTQ